MMDVRAEGLFDMQWLDLHPFQPFIDLAVHLLQSGDAYLADETLNTHSMILSSVDVV